MLKKKTINFKIKTQEPCQNYKFVKMGSFTNKNTDKETNRHRTSKSLNL